MKITRSWANIRVYIVRSVCTNLDSGDMLIILTTILISCIFIWKIFFPVPDPIAGVYSQSGNRGILKQICMYILLKLRKYQSDGKQSKNVGLGVNLSKNIKELESVKVTIFLMNAIQNIFLGTWFQCSCNWCCAVHRLGCCSDVWCLVYSFTSLWQEDHRMEPTSS